MQRGHGFRSCLAFLCCSLLLGTVESLLLRSSQPSKSVNKTNNLVDLAKIAEWIPPKNLKPLELGKWNPDLATANVTDKIYGQSAVSSQYMGCNSSSCFVNSVKVDEELGDQLVLILGCSLDINAIAYFCSAATGVPMDSIVNSAVMSYLVHCTVGKFTFVYSFHPGSSAPPYSDSYNAALGTTKDIVTKTKKDVVEKFGKAPSYIVVDASLWDVSNWWQKLGRPPYPYPVPDPVIQQWCHKDVPALLNFISTTFDGTPIAFRTPPTIFSNPNGFGLSALTVELMVNCIEFHKDGWGRIYGGVFGLIDYHHFVDQVLQASGNGASNWYRDALHPGPQLSLMYINAILTSIKAHVTMMANLNKQKR